MTKQATLNGQLMHSGVTERSDRLMNYFLAGYFLIGLILAFFFDTWLIALGVGSLSVTAYYSAKILLPGSTLYQYVLGAVFGVFMAQFIYQLHGMFEMHFFAFIGSAILITYQKWKLQLPLLITVFVHHSVFGYLQNIGFAGVYFTQLDYFTLQTFIIHILLTMTIMFICGLWSYQLKKYSEVQIRQTLKMAALEKESYISLERKEKERALEERNSILESIGDAFFATDKQLNVTYWNNMAEKSLKRFRQKTIGRNLCDIYPDAVKTPFYHYFIEALHNNLPVHFEAAYFTAGDWFETSIYPGENGLSVYIKDISERKNSELKLKELNENLGQQAKILALSNAQLEEFAYVASHDLQEPLRMITSFMGLLKKRYGDVIDEKGKQYIHFAVDGGKRMRQIILDLLDYSRIGRLEEKKEDIDLNALLDEMKILFRKTIRDQQATISSDALPVLYNARAPIRQVFQNLIANALKYQKAGEAPLIHVTCAETSCFWEFSVKDNGIGISRDYFDTIFIIFKRLHTNNEYQGTGMGLAITKKIVENLGGKIWVDSEEGKGTTFHFTIAKNPEK